MSSANILAINTAHDYLCLALSVSGRRFNFMEQVGNRQSQYIIGQISQLLIEAKINVSELDLIAYVEGPGSFTGLRVGLSVAMGLGLGANAKLIPIPSFAIYAKATGLIGEIVVGLDARLNQIYLAGINTRTLEYFMEPQLIDPENILLNENYNLVGDGFSVYKEQLRLEFKDSIINMDYPSATVMLDIIEMNYYPGILPHEANLFYLRNKVAKSLEEQMITNGNKIS